MKENIFIFEGATSPLVLSRAYDVEWICEYDMRWWVFLSLRT